MEKKYKLKLQKELEEEMTEKELIVVAGCILHDIGKIKELTTDNLGNATYTMDGNMFGHLMMGVYYRI